jgi:DNA topoisomerase-3
LGRGRSRYLLSFEKGSNLIKILPDIIKSAELTANWENKLKKVEKGELSDVDFMAEIAEFTRDIVKSNKTANPEYANLFSLESSLNSKFAALGDCPRCKKSVRDFYNAFKCENRDCGFIINKNDMFFTSAKKELTAQIISEILKNGRVKINGLYSKKHNRTYDAYVIFKDTDGKWVNFECEKKQIK